MIRKNRIAKILSFAMATSLLLGACGTNNPSPTTDGETTAAQTDGQTSPDETEDTNPDETDPSGSEDPGTDEPEEALAAPNYVPDEKVTLTYHGWENDLNFAILTDYFARSHENIEVVRFDTPIEGDDDLTRLAATGDMPDIISINNLGSAIKNGWVMDVKPLYDADPIAAEVNYQNIIDSLTHFDSLYALPTTVYINALMVNIDLLERNNIPIPEYTWTYSDHEEILKAATVAGESRGNVDVRWSLDYYPGTYKNDSVGRMWFNAETGQFQLDQNFIDVVNHFEGLLDANVSIWEHADRLGLPWELEEGDPERERQELARQQFLIDAIGVDDDGWAVNKTASHAWDGAGMGWTERDQRYDGFKYDLYPYPMNDDQPYENPRIGVFTDLAAVSSTAENPEAAYEFLRYISYETQGWLDRYDGLMNYDREEYIEKYNFSEETIANLPESAEHLYATQGPHMNALPASNTNAARDAWREFHPIGSPDATPGYHYLIDFTEDAYVDMGRNFPGYDEAKNYVNDQIWSQVINGDMAPGDIAQEVEAEANRIIDTWQSDIEAAIGAN